MIAPKTKLVLSVLVLGLLLEAPARSAQAPPPKIDFEKSVLPIMKKSCFPCHAPSLIDHVSVLPDPYFVKRQEVEIQHGQDDFVMGPQFPFPDDLTPKKQLDKMEKKLSKHKMPPETQKALKLGIDLTSLQRKLLLDWIVQTRADSSK